MTQYLSQSLLTEELSRIAETELPPRRSILLERYYDLTPPGETDIVEDLCSNAASSADISAEPLIAVIGVGYVGKHLVQVFSKKHSVIGYDVSPNRTKQLTEEFTNRDQVTFTSTAKDLAVATHFLISVPTLLLPDKTVDSSFLRNSLAVVALHGRRGSVVVIESSVAVGMTRELLGPLARERQFFAGMSPERVDPGRTHPPACAIPKVISGLDDVVPGSLEAITRLYETAFDSVVQVSQPEVAEMMKLYENCQRMVCIAYANEMADACISHGIDPFEVCRAAATKPFGYMPFTPSLGVGGHCIPVNPYYLLSNNHFPLLHKAAERMRTRPSIIAQRIMQRLGREIENRPQQSRSRVLVVGMGFKAGQSNLENSPGLSLAQSLLLTDKVAVTWLDPLVPPEAVPQIPNLHPEGWKLETLESRFDMIVVAVRQYGVDFEVLSKLRNVITELWCC